MGHILNLLFVLVVEENLRLVEAQLNALNAKSDASASAFPTSDLGVKSRLALDAEYLSLMFVGTARSMRKGGRLLRYVKNSHHQPMSKGREKHMHLSETL